MSEEKKASIKAEVFSWVKVIVSAIIIALLVDFFIIANAVVPTGSMETTIPAGSRIMGLRLYYDFKEPERGDIVIFYAPDEVEELYIKRVIGLPGDKVVIDNAQIYINDSKVPLEEPYLREAWVINNGYYEFNVPQNCYLMLGDNRNSSIDSRVWENTYVNRNAIIAKAKCVYFPFNHIKSLDDEIR